MNRFVGLLLAVLDMACILAGLFCAWMFWLWWAPMLQRMVQVEFIELLVPNPWMPAGLVYLAAWVVALRRLGMHDPGRMENSVRIVSSVARSTLVMAVFTVLINFIQGDRVYPKGLIIPFLVFTWGWLTAARLATFRALLRLETPPTAANAVIVGIEEDGAAMAERIWCIRSR